MRTASDLGEGAGKYCRPIWRYGDHSRINFTDYPNHKSQQDQILRMTNENGHTNKDIEKVDQWQQSLCGEKYWRYKLHTNSKKYRLRRIITHNWDNIL